MYMPLHPRTHTSTIMQPPLLKITFIMIPPIPHLPIIQTPTHPTRTRIRPFLQFLRDGLQFATEIQILGHELADLRVFVVAPERFRLPRIGRVDVDVEGGMPVRGPADLGPAGDHVCEEVGGGPGVGGASEAVDFLFGGIGDAEAC